MLGPKQQQLKAYIENANEDSLDSAGDQWRQAASGETKSEGLEAHDVVPGESFRQAKCSPAHTGSPRQFVTSRKLTPPRPPG